MLLQEEQSRSSRSLFKAMVEANGHVKSKAWSRFGDKNVIVGLLRRRKLYMYVSVAVEDAKAKTAFEATNQGCLACVTLLRLRFLHSGLLSCETVRVADSFSLYDGKMVSEAVAGATV